MNQVVLIGPIASGKSSVAWDLSRRTGQRNVPLDEVRWAYYYQAGYDRLEERRRMREEGPLARFDYWEPFNAFAVERALADFPDAIIDFGAGNSDYKDEALLARVEAALRSVRHVILLLPSADIEESAGILSERLPSDMDPEHRDLIGQLNRGFLTSPSNGRLATATVYTGRRPVEEVCAEVLEIVRND